MNKSRSARQRRSKRGRGQDFGGNEAGTPCNKAFGKYVLCRYPIDWDSEYHRHLLPNTREISLAARDSHDRVPDFRCQAVPGGDKLW